MQRVAARLVARAAAAEAPGAAALAQPRRHQSRPAQPLNLTWYDKGPTGIPVPGGIRRAEAERMAEDFHEAVPTSPLPARPVPATSADFEKARREYETAVSQWRRSFREQVAAREAREAAAIQAFRDRVMARRVENAAARAARREARLAAQAKTLEATRAAKQLRQAASRRAQELRLERVNERRQEWLDALEADAAAWIKEDEVETKITPELFATKYAWQYVKWFEVKEKMKRAEEAARRARVPGTPLKEVLPVDAEFAADWESDEEGNQLVNEGARVADAVAAAHGAREVAALALARRAAAAAGRAFPEPNFDASGAPVQGSGGGASADAVSRMRRSGVQLEDLYHGTAPASSFSTVVSAYEAWVAEQVAADLAKRAAKKAGGAAAPAAAGTPEAAAAASAASSDDGERAVETAYVEWCVAQGLVEPLYYALLRKAGRLAQGVAAGTYNDTGLSTLRARWGAWMDAVAAVIEGQPGWQDTVVEGAAAAEAAAAAAAAATPAEDGSAGTDFAMDDRNVAAGVALGAGAPEAPKA